MKKFICFIASVLSLSVIFASGWAAGTRNYTDESPTAAKIEKSEENIEENKSNNGRRSDSQTEKDRDCNHEFRFKVPFSHFERDEMPLKPKAAL